MVLFAAMHATLLGCDDGGSAQTPDAAAADAADEYCPDPIPSLWEDINLNDFELVPIVDELDLSTATPAEPVTYWELRRWGDNSKTDVAASIGDKCAEAADRAACESQLDALSPTWPMGFGPNHCRPSTCVYYAVVNQGDDNRIIASAEDLIELLAPIDSPTDAVLVALAGGFSFLGEDNAVSGVRAVEGGYEILAETVVADCSPILRDRLHFFVSSNGEIMDQRQQRYYCDQGCY